jgi:N-acetylmuramoyl-L-alanine amidase CwlA
VQIQRDLIGVNYRAGRQQHPIRAIVIHVMEGSMAGTRSWFGNPQSKVSAHYGVSRKGQVVQYVDDGDTAQHAGLKVRPTAEIVKEMGTVNPNLYTIGIEFEGKAHQEPTEAQLDAGAELIAQLSQKHGIPLDAKHVIPHRSIRADKTCPGKIGIAALLELAAPATRPEVPRPGDRRLSASLGEPVILTRYVSDDEWYYVTESELSQLGKRAGTDWSSMPLP